ncbi:MAG: pyridoxamine 5'-phosphate oxidase family protein [Proteobacteria bacterium]|nr:pyridoxamine 5'-phosphate oxidase family protein [Pseudomonadota bacterium]
MQTDPRRQLQEILAQAQDMTVATVRPDGWPQATTVSFAADGCTVYFGCSAQSQKARNLSHDRRVSATVNLPYRTWAEIRGVSLSGRAEDVTDPAELARVGKLFLAKFPQLGDYLGAQPGEMTIFRIDPAFASVLDYREGFGAHELIGMSPAFA